MRKIPKIWLLISLGLLAISASCKKKTVSPQIQQINSCVECGGIFDVDLKDEKVKLSYDTTIRNWKVSNKNFTAIIPCKFPKELLIEGKEFTFDGKATPVEGKFTVFHYIICIEKIH